MASFRAAVAISAAPALADATRPTRTRSVPRARPSPTCRSRPLRQLQRRVASPYVITMTAPSAIPNGDTITVTDSDRATPSWLRPCARRACRWWTPMPPTASQSGPQTVVSVALGALVITLNSTCNIAAGDTVKIGLTVNDPTANFFSAWPRRLTAPPWTPTRSRSTPFRPRSSAASVTVGYGAIYTIAGLGTDPTFPWSIAEPYCVPLAILRPIPSQPVVTSRARPPLLRAPRNSIGWYGSTNGAGYSVTYTPSGGPSPRPPSRPLRLARSVARVEQHRRPSSCHGHPRRFDHHPHGGGPQPPAPRRCSYPVTIVAAVHGSSRPARPRYDT